MAKISVSLPDAAVDLLDSICKDSGASRSSLISAAISVMFNPDTLRSGTVRAVINRVVARARDANEAEK